MRRLALSAALLAVGQTDAAPTIDLLLQRAGAYVVEFETRFASVVAEERYTHFAPAGTHGTRNARSVLGNLVRRDLKSDFLMVKVPSENQWLPFRDVYEVDGTPVRDREDRLTKLFLQPSATAIEQATQIIE